LVIDPFSEEIGLRFPKTEADILLVTHNHPDHNNIKGVKGADPKEGEGTPFLISGPGEYEIKEVYIQGIRSSHNNQKDGGENTIYVIEAEDLRLCHLGDLGQKELTTGQLEEIGNVDILMIPIGGGPTIDAKDAVKIMSQIEPRIIIPMHYALPKLKMKLDGLDKFLKAVGVKNPQPRPKLTIKKKDISEEAVKIIPLQP